MPKEKTNLVIVESPSKAKTIGKYLGPDYEVKASMGHLRDLPKSTLGVDIEHDFEPEYRPLAGKEAIIKELRDSAKKCQNVYLATDPDREGEAISWHLKYLLDIPDDKTMRVTFNPPAVEPAQPPTNISSTSTVLEKTGHCPKSTVA